MRFSLLLALIGCPWISERDFDENIRDQDGDGSVDVRFGGPDCLDNDPSVLNCDLDGDGFRSFATGGVDCDDNNPAIHPDAPEQCNEQDDDCDGLIDDADQVLSPPLWYFDGDDDGVGTEEITTTMCNPGPGWVLIDGDCDDGDPSTRPGINETCEPVDRNCDGDLYADAAGVVPWFSDHDGDGWGGTEEERSCAPSDSAYVTNNLDCDDTDAAITTSIPWYRDADGDGAGAGAATASCAPPPHHVAVDGDCDDHNPAVITATTVFRDADGDGFGVDPHLSTDVIHDACGIPSGYVLLSGDCDDGRATIFPEAPEVCNGRDDDCDGRIDDFAINGLTFYDDIDGDGFGNPSSSVIACTASPHRVDNADDCNDLDPHSYPGAPELCYDGQRQDCTDAHLDDCDGDGFIDASHGGPDCDDNNPGRGPNAPEICDGIDNDCDGFIDDADTDVDLHTAGDWFADLDGDGFGAGVATFACAPPPHSVNNSLDCDDTDANLTPDSLWFEDTDGDGFGAGAGIHSCAAPTPTAVQRGDDCDDSRPTTYPGAPETCDSVDNDCDGVIDDSPIDGGMFWVDNDHDGFGAPNGSILACVATDGVAANATDCNDADPDSYPGAPELCGDGLRQDCSGFDVYDCDSDGYLDVHAGGLDCDDEDRSIQPDAAEICDGRDNDCDGLTDIDDPQIDLSTTRDYYADIDHDGYGDLSSPLTSCEQPSGYVLSSTDCDDADPAISPAADERCLTAADDDCDGLANDADPEGAVDAQWYYPDADSDGAGTPVGAIQACIQPANTALNAVDCDDFDPTTQPGATEICDGRDNDCDGLIDDDDPTTTGQSVWYRDNDSDGYPRYATFAIACQPPAVDYIADPGEEDCNDNNLRIHPNQAEACEPPGTDDNCDGLIDAADPSWAGTLFYRDADADGYGNNGITEASCTTVPGFVTRGGDCNDDDPAIHPASVWYADNDHDGYGLSSTTVISCNPPGSWALQGADCDDTRADISPGTNEICRVGGVAPVDEDCDGLTDEQDPSLVNGFPHYPDADGDGFGDPAPSLTTSRCLDPTDTWIPSSLPPDCDDTDPHTYPGAPEIWYDGTDQACDLGTDFDQDGDGYDQNAGDCDDLDPAIHPGAAEIWYDNIDQNCDGADDFDQDGDGFAAILPDPSPYTGPLPPDCDDTDASQHFAHLPYDSSGSLQALVDSNCDSVIQLPAGVFEPIVVHGGTIQLVGTTDPTPATAADCTPTTNYSCLKGNGGSVVEVAAGKVILQDLVIFDGDAVRGGGLHIREGQQAHAIRSVFTQNRAAFTGGGVYALGRFESTDSRFSENTSQIKGGAIYVDRAALVLTGGSVSDNQSATAGIYAARPQELSITGVELRHNSDPAIHLIQAAADATLTESVVINPQAIDVENEGSGRLLLTDTVLAGALQSASPVYALRTALAGNSSSEFTQSYGSLESCLSLVPTLKFSNSGGQITDSYVSLWSDPSGNHRSSIEGEGSGGLGLHLSHSGFTELSPAGFETGVFHYTPGYFGQLSAPCNGQSDVCLDLPGSTIVESGDPMFVRYHPHLDPRLWDLHLKPGSALRHAGTGGQDIGLYPNPTSYDIDSDNDGLPDGYELAVFGDLITPGATDSDNDGLTNLTEYNLGSHPLLQDTDGDGLSDHDETTEATNPLSPDTDGDGLSDGDEHSLSTDPLLQDTDGDGLSDGLEVNGWDDRGVHDSSDPLLQDTDGDGLTDPEDKYYFTDPRAADTDGDGLLDSFEIFGADGNPYTEWYSDPHLVDSDYDGLTDLMEWDYQTSSPCVIGSFPYPYTFLNPYSEDTDSDGLTDLEEYHTYLTCGTQQDTDGDHLSDSAELTQSTDPLNEDTDGDGLKDGAELDPYTYYFYGTCLPSSPLLVDTDGDGLTDQEECLEQLPAMCSSPADPTLLDSDADTLDDATEVAMGTCPTLADTDGDGADDASDTAPLNPAQQ